MDILEGLNAAQQEAVTTTEGFVRVIAGAGSGKTRALTHRFAYLVNDLGVLPGNILCVTFTNKAANEMRQRIHKMTGDNDTGYICTFHSFCVSVLQEDSNAVQYPKSFMVLDNSDIDALLKLIYEERGLTLKDMSFSKARDMIEIKKLIKEPFYYRDMLSLSLEELKSKYLQAVEAEDIIFYGYLYQEKKCFGLDYNDLIKFSLHIFAENEDIKLKWQQRLEYIMIDEFQDIDQLQYELMNVLCGYHKNLFIVGDPDQTIYTWRGANVKFLLDFATNYPNVKTIMMNENYRSTPEILKVANSLIDKNTVRIKKELLPMQGHGFKPICHHGIHGEEEALWIAEHIKILYEQGIAYSAMTILYRAHYLTRQLEAALLKEKIPYEIYSGVQFFERQEIKDALSYLRLIVLRDDLSFRRVANNPKRNLGLKRMEFLESCAEQQQCSLYEALERNIDNEIFKGTKGKQLLKLVESFGNYGQQSITEVLSAILDKSGYEAMLRTEGNQARLDNLAELKQAAQDYEINCGEECTLEDYLKHVALFTNMEIGSGADKVKLMTVHTAKGLEFPYVFLCGLNEGIFPSRKTKTFAAMEEERRLAFVAVTRAEQGLFLTEAQGFNVDGAPRYPSRFIFDIDHELLDYEPAPDAELLEQAQNYIRIASNWLETEAGDTWGVGNRVKHKVFGEGNIIGVDFVKKAYIINFDNMNTSRQLSFKAPLEKI